MRFDLLKQLEEWVFDCVGFVPAILFSLASYSRAMLACSEQKFRGISLSNSRFFKLFRSHPTLLKKCPLYSLFSLVLAAHVGYFEPWGKDADLKVPQETSSSKERSLATEIAQLVIRFHQEVISPVDGPRSHYRPSSSQYMQQAMDQYGFFKGFIMGCDRLLRENDEEWVYRKVQYDGKTYKYDPARVNKYE